MRFIPWVGEQEEIWAKDWDISRFLRRFPHISELILGMREMLPARKFTLVDLIVADHKVGDPTCRDVRWHFDGDFRGDNAYVLWSRGPNRTEFPETIPLLDPPGDREAQNRYLEGLGLRGAEIPEMTAVPYDSRTPHRGVVCKISGKRIFARLLATDTIRPKNFIGRKR